MAARHRWWQVGLMVLALAACQQSSREAAPSSPASTPSPVEAAPPPPPPAPTVAKPAPEAREEASEYKLSREEPPAVAPAKKNGAPKKKAPPKEAAPREAAKAGEAAAPEGQAYGVVRVWFGTDRNDTGSDVPRERFGDDRGETIRYGTVEVSIPPGHVKGELESPLVLRERFETPEKHVVLLRVDVEEASRYWAGLRQRLADGKRNVLVFVHGYNTSFEDAARRTAQIAWDVEFPGVPMFYSWPSRGSVAKYPHDETNVEWAQSNLRGFLRDIALNLDAEGIYLVAHSMGNRALTRAFIDVGRELPADKLALFREVILTAPDIDADVFRRDIAPQLVAIGTSVTLYASSKDRALKASRAVHGKPRAGDSGGDLVVVRGMETVDASDIDTSVIGLGHAYVAESRPVLQDLFWLITDHKRAAQRFGLETLRNASGETYWKFRR